MTPLTSAQNYQLLSRVAVVFAIFLLAILSVYTVLGIYGDGSLFLYSILTKKTFWDFDLPRVYVQRITQAPVVLAIYFGVKNLTSLTYLHSFGAIGLTILIWCAALYQQLRSPYFWTILIAFSVTFLCSGFFGIGEYNITYALAGYCFAVLLKNKFGYFNSFSLLVVAVALTHSYEAMVFLGPTLIILCVFKISQQGNSLSLYEKLLLIISAFLFLFSTFISAYSIAYPRVPENLVGSIYNIKDTLKSIQFLFALFMLSMYFIIPKISSKNQSWVMSISIVVSATFVCIQPLWNPPGLHYVFRTTSGLLLCIVFLLTLLEISLTSIKFKGKSFYVDHLIESSVGLKRSIISFVFWLALLVPMIIYLFSFSQWIKKVESAAINQHQWIEIGKINKPRLDGPFITSWSAPALSIILRGNPNAGLLNNSPVGWQPFDPLTLPGNILENYRQGLPLNIFVPGK